MTPRLTLGRLRAILAVSIALNLFLVALVGAEHWRAVQLQRMAVPVIGALERQGLQDPEGTLQRLAGRLPHEDGALLLGASRDRLTQLLSARAGFISAVERTRDEIARDQVDPVALQAAISEARRARQQLGPVLEEILLEAVPRMTPEGRRALSQMRGVAAP